MVVIIIMVLVTLLELLVPFWGILFWRLFRAITRLVRYLNLVGIELNICYLD